MSYVPVFAISPGLLGGHPLSREVQLCLQTDKMQCYVLDIAQDSELVAQGHTAAERPSQDLNVEHVCPVARTWHLLNFCVVSCPPTPI